MIPFARMIKYGHIDQRNTVLDIDFSRQNVGDTNIIDFTGNNIFQQDGVTGLGTVEYNSTIGSNVMRFNSSRYSTAMKSVLQLRDVEFRIVMVINNNNASTGEIICTGDYNGARIPGFNFNNTRNGSTGTNYALFMDDGGNFVNHQFGVALNVGWDVVEIHRDKLGFHCTVNGVTTSFAQYFPGNGTKFAIGGSYTGGTNVYWNGLMKSLYIETKGSII